MHDPSTLAFEIKSPFKSLDGYRRPLVTIWHVDPEKDGTDDSCGWFKRARHGDNKMVERIEKSFDFDWDRTWTYDPSEDGDGTPEEMERGKKTYFSGFFNPKDGKPVMAVQAIVLNLFFLAAGQYFDPTGNRRNWNKSRKWMQNNLFDILQFAQNPVDSLHDSVTMKFGDDGYESATESQRVKMRKERIRNMADIIYGWILRADQKWWQHARWHFWHWKFQFHGPKWLTSESKVFHDECSECGVSISDKSKIRIE